MPIYYIYIFSLYIIVSLIHNCVTPWPHRNTGICRHQIRNNPIISRERIVSLCSSGTINNLNKHTLQTVITGYNQSVTGCVSQRRQCSCYSTKTHVNSMILIFKLNLTSLRNIHIKSGLR